HRRLLSVVYCCRFNGHPDITVLTGSSTLSSLPTRFIYQASLASHAWLACSGPMASIPPRQMNKPSARFSYISNRHVEFATSKSFACRKSSGGKREPWTKLFNSALPHPID